MVHDQSESIVQTKDSSFYRTQYIKKLESLKEKLSEKFDIVTYGFAKSLETSLDSSYSNKLTDISQALDQIYNQYANQNIGAILLSTDGIYNTGQNPLYTVRRKPNIPVFTIGLGDTTIAKDLYINDVVHNDITFLGNDFPVRVDISQNGYTNETVKVDIFEKGQLLSSKTVAFESNQQDVTVDFKFKAESVGYRKYTVKISELEDEFTVKNNSQNFYLNVIDGRQKILLTYSYTHPDISALNYVIKNNKNYDLTVLPISKLKGDLTSYDLIIVHNYQSGAKALDNLIKTNEVPFLHIIGVKADFKKLVNANIGLNGTGRNSEDIVFEGNVNFNEIIFEKAIFNLLNNAPPLKSPQGNISFSESVQTIAYQNIGNITLTKPLIYTSQKQDNKYAVVLGEGLWRWRLFDQLQNETTKNFEAFFSQIVNYLAIKENKDPFKVNQDNEYEESDQVIVRAELYNASYQRTNQSEVKYQLTDEEGKVFDYVFFKTNDSYLLDLGRLKQGVYQWQASTSFENQTYVKRGAFVVKEAKKELLNLTADHRLLKNLSAYTKAQFYEFDNLDIAANDLLNREDIVSIAYQEKSFKDIIDYKWLFILVILFVTTEWFVRKFLGGY